MRFGEVEFDRGRGSLKVGGQPVDIDRNSLAILSLLLDEAGSEVSKQRLLDAGWPDRIVHENSLAKAIARLREVLGEQGSDLRTIYGFGYKLEADVQSSGPADPQPAAPSRAPRGAPYRRAAFLAAAGILLGLAALTAAAEAGFFGAGGAASQFRKSPPAIADAPDAIGRILWVDDNPKNNTFEQALFEERRLAVHPVPSSTDALKLLSIYDYDVVISDMGRGEDRLAGVRLVEQMRSLGNHTPFYIYTVRPDQPEQQKAQREIVSQAGADGLAVTPEEIRAQILEFFGNPPPRTQE